MPIAYCNKKKMKLFLTFIFNLDHCKKKDIGYILGIIRLTKTALQLYFE